MLEESEMGPIMVLANHPIPAGLERFYFEIEIDPDIGSDVDMWIAIGFATQPARLSDMPGWFNPIAPSWALHALDGQIHANSDTHSRDYAASFGKGTTIGCGVIFPNGVDGIIFFTRDGKPLGVAVDKGVRGRLYPAVGLTEPSAIRANWGDQSDERPFRWALANGGRYDLEDVEVKATDGENCDASKG